jgi:hypothetical protein
LRRFSAAAAIVQGLAVDGRSARSNQPLSDGISPSPKPKYKQ